MGGDFRGGSISVRAYRIHPGFFSKPNHQHKNVRVISKIFVHYEQAFSTIR